MDFILGQRINENCGLWTRMIWQGNNEISISFFFSSFSPFFVVQFDDELVVEGKEVKSDHEVGIWRLMI